MPKDKINKDELAEVVYQTIQRNFNVGEFLKGVNYSIFNDYLQDEIETSDAVVSAYIFHFWIIIFSIRKILPNLYNEIRNSCIKLWWNRGKLEGVFKNLENFMLAINSDFNKYESGVADKNDPVFVLSTTFLNYLFKKEITDARAIMYVAGHFSETLKAYQKIFSQVSVIDTV